jgi:hypothetical protein
MVIKQITSVDIASYQSSELFHIFNNDIFKQLPNNYDNLKTKEEIIMLLVNFLKYQSENEKDKPPIHLNVIGLQKEKYDM